MSAGHLQIKINSLSPTDPEKGVVCLDRGFFADLAKPMDIGTFDINNEETKINLYRAEEIGTFSSA